MSNSFYVKPIRLSTTSKSLYYNNSTGEITHGATNIYYNNSGSGTMTQTNYNNAQFSITGTSNTSLLFAQGLDAGFWFLTVSVSITFAVPGIFVDSTAISIDASQNDMRNSFTSPRIFIQPCFSYTSVANETITHNFSAYANIANSTTTYCNFSLYSRSGTTFVNTDISYSYSYIYQKLS
jgi:hypothetical protein